MWRSGEKGTAVSGQSQGLGNVAASNSIHTAALPFVFPIVLTHCIALILQNKKLRLQCSFIRGFTALGGRGAEVVKLQTYLCRIARVSK